MNEEKDLRVLAEGFAKEYQDLINKYYGNLQEPDFEPFGMKLRELLPLTDMKLGDQITTTATISIPLDTDPPDTDVSF